MSMFSAILSKLGVGGNKPAAEGAPRPAPPQSPDASLGAAAATAPAPVAISEVDVVAKLEQLAASNLQKLNWKVSIVDLLKLLDLDSSLPARKELATELGCPPEKMGDSAQMNMWLHKTVMQRLAENGGNIPRDFFRRRLAPRPSRRPAVSHPGLASPTLLLHTETEVYRGAMGADDEIRFRS